MVCHLYTFSGVSNIDLWRYTFKIEDYWIETLMDFRQKTLALDTLDIHNRSIRRSCQKLYLYSMDICIVIQVVVVIWSKVTLLSVCLIQNLFISPLNNILPVGTASVELVFSGMKHVKIELWNKTGDQWVNDRLVTFIERDIFIYISNNDILIIFRKCLLE